MIIVLICRYCGHETTFKSKATVRSNEGRGFVKLNCEDCNSRHYLDLGVRKGGKSAAIKKQEKTRKEKAESDLRERYEATADAVVRPWSSLSDNERHNIAWKLGHR
jgi:hypothetical protein